MTPTDVSTLPELSAPYWFIELFKIIGFVLHSLPMHLWLTGLPVALLLVLFNRRNGGFYGRRLLSQFPVILALGINFGIVPLLFIQAAYYKAFYSATILMALHWCSILVLVGVAYYGVYGCSFLIKRPKRRWAIFCGIPSSICLIGCGLIFASLFTFMALPSEWSAVYAKTSASASGAVSGMGTYWRNPVVFLRFASIVGLAFSTLSFWTVFDTVCLYGAKNDLNGSASDNEKSSKKKSSSKQTVESASASTAKMSKKDKRKLRQQKEGTFASEEEELAWMAAQEAAEQEAAQEDKAAKKNKEEPKVFTSADYYRWSLRMASCLSWFGLLIAGSALYFLFFHFLPKEDPNLLYLYQTSWKYLLYATIAVPVLPVFVLILSTWRKFGGKTIVFLMTLSEMTILTVYAVTRQLIQNAQLKDFLDVASIKVVPVWNPLVIFLIVFVFGLLLIGWMIRQMAKA